MKPKMNAKFINCGNSLQVAMKLQSGGHVGFNHYETKDNGKSIRVIET